MLRLTSVNVSDLICWPLPIEMPSMLRESKVTLNARNMAVVSLMRCAALYGGRSTPSLARPHR